MLGPIIRGEKVTMRPPRAEDLASFIDWLANQDVTRTLSRTFPLSLRQEERWLEEQAESETAVIWALETEMDGAPTLVGSTGIHHIDWRNRHAVTGIVIGDRRLWGRGIASEVIQLRTRYAFQELGLNKLKSMYLQDNVASGLAQAKAGYRKVGIHRQEFFREGRWHDAVVTEVLREDLDL